MDFAPAGPYIATLNAINAAGAYSPLITMTRPDVALFCNLLVFVDRYADLREDRAPEILSQESGAVAFLGSIPWLHPERTRWTLELLATAVRLAVLGEMRFKHALACRRPNEYSPQVQPMILTPGHGTLPMGHATETFIMAFVLWQLLTRSGVGPYTDLSWGVQLFRLASRVAMNRIVAGMHFTVDAAAGEVLGLTLGQYFLARCGVTPSYTPWTFDGTLFPDPKPAVGPRPPRRTTGISTGPSSSISRLRAAPAPRPDPYGLRKCRRRRRQCEPESHSSMALGPGGRRVAMSPAKSKSDKSGADLRLSYEHLVDPGADWVLGSPTAHDFDDINKLGPGGDYFFLPERKNRYWLPILVGLRKITVDDFAAGAQFDGLPNSDLLKKQWTSCTVFSVLDIKGPGAADQNFYCAPTVTKAFFDLLSDRPELRQVVASVTLGLPVDAELLPQTIPIPPAKLPI